MPISILNTIERIYGTMGLSASQARLLTITARLTSNEYESQQISNAKMRLATQSEAASKEYITALNTTQLQMMTYDAQGTAITTPLTANALYQYSDLKNQYALVNTSGQILISNGDAENFKKSATLDEFLECYGITKEFKSPTLEECALKLASNSTDTYADGTPIGGVNDYYQEWIAAIDELTSTGSYINEDGTTITANEVDYQSEKLIAFQNYNNALAAYEDTLIKYNANLVDDEAVTKARDSLSNAKSTYSNYTTYDQWIKSKLAYVSAVDDDGNQILDKNGQPVQVFSDLYKNSEKYYEVLAEYNAEAENLGCNSIEDTYTYSDESKAQWYTNLWYRLNGSSSDKSALGEYGTNYAILDNKLASSSQWVQDALKQGAISLEVATYETSTNTIDDMDNPLSVTLNGISWKSTSYSSCSDITEQDNESAIARAEAEYTRKNKEIDSKDKKYENQIKALDTEHNALQTEYESVQTAMNKNIERSFKTFNG